ncbi:MAG: lytic transglycosylase domain-containing protein [Thalassovita sp.]
MRRAPHKAQDRTRPLRKALTALWLAIVALLPFIDRASASVMDCEQIAAQTGARNGLPPALLPAISRVETGLKQGDKGVRGWPWTLNVQGKGYYFKTREEALAKLRSVVQSGVTNVDVGCMQINYRWHHENFASLEDMMEPQANTQYAAEFLTRLARRHGTWEAATRYYHSSDSDRGEAYLGRVNRVLAKLPQDQPSFVASTASSQPQMTAQATSSASRRAVIETRAGVLAMANAPLIALDGRMVGSKVTLPDSPLPKITALVAQPRVSHGRVRAKRARVSTNRQALVNQLRSEFAN